MPKLAHSVHDWAQRMMSRDMSRLRIATHSRPALSLHDRPCCEATLAPHVCFLTVLPERGLVHGSLRQEGMCKRSTSLSSCACVLEETMCMLISHVEAIS